ncbi:MAG: ATP-binding protein [Angustibacter sp.]
MAVWRREPPGTAVVTADIVLTVGLFVLGRVAMPLEYEGGDWESFYYGYANNALVIAVATARARWLLPCGIVTASGGWVFYLGGTDKFGGVLSTIVGCLGFVLIPIVVRVSATFMRRVAADGDRARDLAARLAREAEERRARVAMHNGTALLRMLAEPDLDPVVQEKIRAQAGHEAWLMRSYLQGQIPANSGKTSGSVASVLLSACAQFQDLRIEHVLDLAPDLPLGEGQAEALRAAVISVLTNVRVHAVAECVVVHIDADHSTGWTVTIHDDGKGFSARPECYGVGLRDVVLGELGRHAMTGTVESRPGFGTTVTITGPHTPVPAGGQRR